MSSWIVWDCRDLKYMCHNPEHALHYLSRAMSMPDALKEAAGSYFGGFPPAYPASVDITCDLQLH